MIVWSTVSELLCAVNANVHNHKYTYVTSVQMLAFVQFIVRFSEFLLDYRISLL